jgi:hypothetical protein
VRTAPGPEPLAGPPAAPPLVRVRTVPDPPEEEGALAFAPLVRVRTGAAATRFERVEPDAPPPPLVRVRGAEEPPIVPLDAAELPELCEPLAAVRGAPAPAATVRRPVPAPVARALLERRVWARSWRTTWSVRRMICVRTSTAGCRTRATRVSLGPERSVYAASAPAVSAAAREASRAVAMRRIGGLLDGCASTVARARQAPAQLQVKLWQGRLRRACAEECRGRAAVLGAQSSRRRGELRWPACVPASPPPAPPSPLSSREEPARLGAVARLNVAELLLLGELEPLPVELGAGVGAGATGAAAGALGVAAVEPVDVLAGPAGADRFRASVRRGALGSVTAGARRRPAEIGSDESPMRWLVSWLVAQVMPAVSTIPSSAASAQRAVCRLMRAP